MITFSVSRSPNYLNILLISVVFGGDIASKGWYKLETVYLDRVVTRTSYDPQPIFLE